MTKGDKIRALRESLDISQVDLAKRVGISKQLLYKYEIGKITNIPQDNVEKLAKALGTSPAYLLGWNEHVGADFLSLSEHEQKLVSAYREHPDRQNAVDILLGIAE